MGISPTHPNLLLERPMTPQEMLDALAYEGMFGIGDQDLDVAKLLDGRGELSLEFWGDDRGWIVASS